MANNCFNLIIPFVTLFAFATLDKKCPAPFGPELQVKQMYVDIGGARQTLSKFYSPNVAISFAKLL